MARKPGKYDAVMHKLPKLQPEKTPYQLKVEAVKSELRRPVEDGGEGLTKAAALARRYAELRREQDRLAGLVYDNNMWVEACNQLLIASQEKAEEGWGEFGAKENTLRLISGDVMRVQPEVYVNINDPAAVRKFFNENNLADKLQPGLKDLADLSKDRLLTGQAEVPGTKLFIKSKVVFVPFKQAKAEEEAQDTLANEF